jgi:transketolase
MTYPSSSPSAFPPPPSHHDMANALRALAMDAVEAAKSGHPGMPMGMADVATVLFTRFLRYDPSWPTWPDRDRFILSGGHGSMLLYGLLYLCGYEAVTLEEIKRFRQMGALTAGHPEVDVEAGIEMTTGPLGQGIASAVGFALAERLAATRFGHELVNHYTYVMAGDGDLMEGISHEAAALAGHWRLHRLIVLFDDNGISIDGPTSLSNSEDTLARYRAYGWHTEQIDGHDPGAIEQALSRAKAVDRPSLIACRTTIGFGAPHKAGTASAHGSPLGAQEIAGARAALNWPHPPFVIPPALISAWRQAGEAGKTLSAAWEERLSGAEALLRDDFNAALAGDVEDVIAPLIADFKAKMATARPTLATRAASKHVLELLVPALPTLLGGSADLTSSNLTKTSHNAPISPPTYLGNYLYYGVREHGMAAIMNGLALHGGFIPYGGTFLSFADYARPAIRLAALMRQRVIHVMTHDSIGLGEDGPTHQPIEQLASLRAMPNLLVLRPADIIETAEAWQVALTQREGPSILALSRQDLPTLRESGEETSENLTARGGYLLRTPLVGPRQVSLLASGSEVELAVKAYTRLEEEGIGCAVISLPCWELFAQQSSEWQDMVLGPASTLRVGIEAAGEFGWHRWLRAGDIFIGMTGFGLSAPANALYTHFGITVDAVVTAVKERL